MSEKNTNAEPELPAFVKKAPELIPLWDWWVKEGRSTVMMLAVAGLAVASFYGVRGWLRGREASANAALVKMSASSGMGGEDLVETQEEAVNSYGSTKVGDKMRVVLAKGYYDDERFEDALKVYDEIIKSGNKDGDIADIALVGRAFALEGMASREESKDGQAAKYRKAAEAFAAYADVAANADSYLLLDAKLGAARCKALAGDKDGAAKDFEALEKDAKDEAVKARIKRVADAVKRFKPRARASLFDAANAAAQAAAPSAPAAKPETKAPAAPAKPEAKAPAKPEAKAPAKPEAKAPAKPEAKAPAKPEAKAPAKPEAKAPAAPAPAKPAAK
ncbi:MAG: hypothetical protein IJ658_03320 [Kiritimatiellae bacterium]|nr:hypothetical protein [Kiritimatiellia bacterium]